MTSSLDADGVEDVQTTLLTKDCLKLAASFVRPAGAASSVTVKLGRPLLNELFYLRPDTAFRSIATPTLVVHGTKDTFIPVTSSREFVSLIDGDATLLEIDGAQHGIAVHDDPKYQDPQTQQWQAQVIQSISEWLI